MAELFADLPRADAPAVPRGLYADIGPGPEGETCGTCRHAMRFWRPSRSWAKCGLMRSNWTGGEGSDIRLRTPACRKWEARQ